MDDDDKNRPLNPDAPTAEDAKRASGGRNPERIPGESPEPPSWLDWIIFLAVSGLFFWLFFYKLLPFIFSLF